MKIEKYTQKEFCREFIHWWKLAYWVKNNPGTWLEVDGVRFGPKTLAGAVKIYDMFRDPRIVEVYASGAPRQFSDTELLLIDLRIDARERMVSIAAEYGTQSGHIAQVLKRYRRRTALNVLRGIEEKKTSVEAIQRLRDAGLA